MTVPQPMMSWLEPSTAQAWVLVFVAGLLEVGWAVGMKATDGFTRFWPTLTVTAVALLSFALLGLAMKTLPVGTAYAVWVGIGAVGATALGMWLYAEPVTTVRLVCILAIVAGVVGLKLAHD